MRLFLLGQQRKDKQGRERGSDRSENDRPAETLCRGEGRKEKDAEAGADDERRRHDRVPHLAGHMGPARGIRRQMFGQVEDVDHMDH